MFRWYRANTCLVKRLNLFFSIPIGPFNYNLSQAPQNLTPWLITNRPQIPQQLHNLLNLSKNRRFLFLIGSIKLNLSFEFWQVIWVTFIRVNCNLSFDRFWFKFWALNFLKLDPGVNSIQWRIYGVCARGLPPPHSGRRWMSGDLKF